MFFLFSEIAMHVSQRRLVVLFLVFFLAAPAWGQISIPGIDPVVVDFEGFLGTGFAPDPEPGQLDSDAFAVTGMSDGNLPFGGTETEGDFARGTSAGGVTTGGIYAYDGGDPDAPWLFVQPVGSDFAPGTITVRYRNDTGATITEVDVAYDIKVHNDQERASTWNFSYSLDDEAYTPVAELDYTSPIAADAPVNWETVERSTTIEDLEVGPGDFIYVRFSSDDAGGSGSRDEIGVDNITLTANTSGPAVPAVSFASPNSQTVTEGTDTQVEIAVQIANAGAESVSVDVVLVGGTADEGDFVGPTTQTVTFPAGDGSVQIAAFALADDEEDEGPETAVFELQNVSDGPGAVIGSPSTYTLTIEDDDAVVPDLVINEIYANPTTGIQYDANNDGVGDSSDDEFIEIVNGGAEAIDLSGYRIEDSQGVGNNRVRHVFPEGTVLQPSQAIVVFGYGSPQGNFGGALVQVSTRESLDLANAGETLTLFDAADVVVTSYAYGSVGSNNSSWTRDPDLSENWVRHCTPTCAEGRRFSPGSRVDGEPFGGGEADAVVTVPKGAASWRMLASPAAEMSVGNLAAQNLVQGIPGEYPGAAANLYTGYSGTGFVAPSGKEEALTSGRGLIWFLYGVRYDPHDEGITDGESESFPLPFTLEAVGAEPAADVTVELHTVGAGWNLLGNPFAEAIDLEQMEVNGGENGLVSIIGQVWDVSSYRLTTDNPLGNTLAIWQGAFFQNGDAASVTFPTDSKLGSGAPFYGRPGAERGRIGFELAGPGWESGQPASLDHAAVLYLHEAAADGWDLRDATKLTPLTSTYATLAFVGERDGAEVLKAQEARPFEGGPFEVPLAFESVGVSGAFALSWPRWDNVPEDWAITLTDAETGAVVDLRSDTLYTFTASAAREPAADDPLAAPQAESLWRSADPRFVLAVGRGTVDGEGGVAPDAFALDAVYPNPVAGAAAVRYALPEAADVRLVVFDVLGRAVATLADAYQAPRSGPLKRAPCGAACRNAAITILALARP